MVDIFSLAKYISDRFMSEYHREMDEMKLHKLVYFIQRESFVRLDKPIIDERFEAWKYGPVMRCLRNRSKVYEAKGLSEAEIAEYGDVLDSVFKLYAGKDSWTLSNISHGESCWRKAKNKETSSNPVEISTEDIREDARNILIRRALYQG